MPKISRRDILVALTGLFTSIGAVWLSTAFLRSFRKPSFIDKNKEYLDIKINKLEPHKVKVIPYMSRGLMLLKRTPAQVQALDDAHPNLLDPYSLDSSQPIELQNDYRSLDKEIFVAWQMCTHLGCGVKYRKKLTTHTPQSETISGFLCACHGASYDLAGRVFKNMPAPRNLNVPNYEFLNDKTIRVWKDDPEK